MPWSHTEGKKWLETEYLRLKPETVVDIGPGAGMYANWFRVMHKAHWTAVEVWEPYVSEFDLDKKYDELILGDAREVELPEADLYILGDVLEHMSKDEALALIEKVKAKAKHVFVSIPIIEYHQGAIYGNPYEEHVYHWDADEMYEALKPGNDGLLSQRYEVIGVYHWIRAEKPAEPAKKPAAKKTTARKTTPKK